VGCILRAVFKIDVVGPLIESERTPARGLLVEPEYNSIGDLLKGMGTLRTRAGTLMTTTIFSSQVMRDDEEDSVFVIYKL
jgi:hypothetical protein